MPEVASIAPCSKLTLSSDVGHSEVVCKFIPPTSVPNLSRQASQTLKLQKPAGQGDKAREMKCKVLAQIVNMTEDLELLKTHGS